VPSAISENMLRLRFFTEATARVKNGQPAHRTTGVPSNNCTQFEVCCAMRWWMSKRCPPISSANTGTVSAVPIQKRLVMSRSSGLSPCSAVASTGSSAMPQMGQLPGPIWRTCGCIGQVNSTWLWSPMAAGLVAAGACAWWPWCP
jgi:hypothetical protein